MKTRRGLKIGIKETRSRQAELKRDGSKLRSSQKPRSEQKSSRTARSGSGTVKLQLVRSEQSGAKKAKSAPAKSKTARSEQKEVQKATSEPAGAPQNTLKAAKVASEPAESNQTTTKGATLSELVVSQQNSSKEAVASDPGISEQTAVKEAVASDPGTSEHTASKVVASDPGISEQTASKETVASDPGVSEQTASNEAIASVLSAQPSPEKTEDHNYSRDPIEELMKLNLPIYVCNPCKRYTFDLYQSAIHCQQFHGSKIFISVVQPFGSKLSPAKRAIEQPNAADVVKRAKLEAAPVKQKPVEKPVVLQISKSREPLVNATPKKWECSKCKRHFDRERQMNMHKCIDIIGKRNSPRRESTGGDAPGVISKASASEVEPTLEMTVSPAGDSHQGDSPQGNPEKTSETSSQKSFTGETDNQEEASHLQQPLEDSEKAVNEEVLNSSREEDNDAEMGHGDVDSSLNDDRDDENVEGSLEVDDEDAGAAKESILNENSVDPKTGIVNAETQWKHRDPPSNEEVNKYIKVIRGGPNGGGKQLDFYMCLICRKVFKTKGILKPHVHGHLGYRPFQCDKCSYSTNHSSCLTAHVKKHTMKTGFQCWYGTCSFVGKTAEELKNHKKTHNRVLPCELCNETFSRQAILLGHLSITHAEEIKEGWGKDFYLRTMMTGYTRSQIVLYECSTCGLKTKTKRDYLKHLKRHNDEHYMKDKTKPKVHSTNTMDPELNWKTTSTEESSTSKKRRSSLPNVNEEPLRCPMCNYTCFDSVLLRKHLFTHPFIYRCCMCEDKFLTYGALNEHVSSHVSEHVTFNVQEKINESIRSSLYLGGKMDKALEADKLQWAQRRTGALAPQSTLTGTNFDELMSKINTPAEPVSQVELEQIGDVFTSITYKKLTPSILRYIHLRFGNVECGVCGKLFPKVGLCKDHTKRHTNVKEYKCAKCPFAVNLRAAFLKHMAKEHGEGEVYFCKVCRFDIFSKETYEHHVELHSKENKGPFTCTWCNTMSESQEEMKNHITSTHPLMSFSESSKILGKGVVIRREKGAPFLVCEVCSETFRRICDLRRHMWKHSSVKRYQCDQCDYGSDKQGNIVSHMRRHSNVKTCPCKICGKSYKTMQALNMHIRTAHMKLKPHKCDKCSYAAAQPVHLRRHVNLHHGEGERRRFRCAFCPDYRASDLQVVKRHYKKKHPTEQLNYAKCCPPDAYSLSAVRKDKHQVIQVVPSIPAAPEVSAEPEQMAEPEQRAEQLQADESYVVDAAAALLVESGDQPPQDIAIQVVASSDAEIIDMQDALPDVINALAALQENDYVAS